MQKRTRRQSKYFAPQNKHKHICDHPGCQEAGEYRAPKDRNLKEYYWFCLKHVQEYNAQWNYYGDGASTEETEDLHRKFRFSSRIRYNFGFDFDSGYNFFDEYTTTTAVPNIRLTPTEHQALQIMELELDDLTAESLKKAYKKAVKKYHPDVNSDTAAEEKFKILSTGYKSLAAKLVPSTAL
jgi:hypothetical protein